MIEAGQIVRTKSKFALVLHPDKTGPCGGLHIRNGRGEFCFGKVCS